MTVLAEIDQIVNLLEADLPTNPRSPTNQRLKRSLQSELSKYFKRLEDAFPFDKIDQIYYKHVSEQLGSETRDMLDPLLATFQDDLTVRLNGWAASAYIKGRAEMITWGKTKAGIPIAYEGPPISKAIDWAEKHSAQLVTQMAEETKQRLAYTISQGIENKRGIPGLARDIRNTFDDMSKYRSELIARTETATSLSQASLDTMEDMGVEGKEWVTVGDDNVSEECQANEDQGVIPVNEPFVSGAMAPPQHPDCRCTIAPVMMR